MQVFAEHKEANCLNGGEQMVCEGWIWARKVLGRDPASTESKSRS